MISSPWPGMRGANRIGQNFGRVQARGDPTSWAGALGISPSSTALCWSNPCYWWQKIEDHRRFFITPLSILYLINPNRHGKVNIGRRPDSPHSFTPRLGVGGPRFSACLSGAAVSGPLTRLPTVKLESGDDGTGPCSGQPLKPAATPGDLPGCRVQEN